MPRKKGPWTYLSTKTVYTSPRFSVHEDSLRGKNGKPVTYSWVRMNHGVSVIPLDAKGNVYLAREYRYARDRYSLEIVSGGIEKGHSPLATAKRELKEETGISAKKWTALGVYDTVTSLIEHQENLFLAEGLTFGAQALDENEEVEVVKMPLARAAKLARSGAITYGFAALGLQLVERLRGKKSS